MTLEFVLDSFNLETLGMVVTLHCTKALLAREPSLLLALSSTVLVKI